MDAKTAETAKKIIAESIGGELRNKPLPGNLKLIGNVLDSMAVTTLLGNLEAAFGFAFDDEDLTAEAFETVDSVLALVEKKLS